MLFLKPFCHVCIKSVPGFCENIAIILLWGSRCILEEISSILASLQTSDCTVPSSWIFSILQSSFYDCEYFSWKTGCHQNKRLRNFKFSTDEFLCFNIFRTYVEICYIFQHVGILNNGKIHSCPKLKMQPVLSFSSFVHNSSINEHKNMK